MRNWKDMKSDEIYSIWKGYCMSCCNGNSLNQYDHPRPMRLTGVEIHYLVEELLKRLDIKELDEK